MQKQIAYRQAVRWNEDVLARFCPTNANIRDRSVLTLSGRRSLPRQKTRQIDLCRKLRTDATS